MRRRPLVLAALALALGAAALLWTRRGAAPTDEEVVRPGTASAGALTGPTLVAPERARPAATSGAVAPAAGPSEIVRKGAVSVLVRDEAGMPMGGARVRLRPPSVEFASRERHTASDGTASFDDVEVGEAWLFVVLAGFEQAGRGIAIRPGVETRAEITLERLLAASGVVLLPTGAPAGGAHVRVGRGGSLQGHTELWFGPESRGRALIPCAADGTFHLELVREQLVTLCAELLPHARAELPLRPRSPVEGLVLRLGAGGRVSGRVLDPQGRPEARAEVFVVRDGVPDLLANPRAVVGPGGGVTGNSLDTTWGSLDGEPSGSTEYEGEGEVLRAERTTTDEAGRFEVGGLALPARVRVLAQGAEETRGASPVVELGPESPTASTEVLLEERVRLLVRVLSPSGRPQRATLQLEGAREHFVDPRAPEGTEALDASGGEVPRTYEFPGLVGGRYVLNALIEGCLPQRVPVEVPSRGTGEIEIRGQAGRSLDVGVVDAAGAPVTGAMLSLSIPAGEGVLEQTLQAQVDELGRARFDGLPLAPGALHVRSETHMDRKLVGVVAGTDLLRVVLEPRPLLTCRLVLDGVNLTHDYLWIEEAGARVSGSRTGQVGADGVFRHRVQNVDTEVLFVLSPWEGARVVLGRHRLAAGQTLDLGEVRVDHGREIRGRVLDGAGRPVVGVGVRAALPGVLDEGDDAFSRRSPTVETDAEGRFLLREVPRGPALVRTQHATWAPATLEEDGTGAEVTLRVVPGAFLTGVFPAGARGGWIEIEAPDGRRLTVTRDLEGAWRAGPLAPGTHRVRMGLVGSAPSDLGTVTLEAGQERSLAQPAR